MSACDSGARHAFRSRSELTRPSPARAALEAGGRALAHVLAQPPQEGPRLLPRPRGCTFSSATSRRWSSTKWQRPTVNGRREHPEASALLPTDPGGHPHRVGSTLDVGKVTMTVTVGASSEQRQGAPLFYSLPSITIDPSRPIAECAGAHPAVCARQVCYATSNNAATISDLPLWRNRHVGTLPATPLMAGGGRSRRGRLVRNDCELSEPSIGSRGHGARRRRGAQNAIFTSVGQSARVRLARVLRVEDRPA